MGTHPIFESDFDCLTDIEYRPDTAMSSNEDEAGNETDNEEPVDEQLLQNRRAILQRALISVETHFSTTKQQLFQERSDLYEIRIKQLRESPDSHPDLKSGISELMDEIRRRKQNTFALKEHKQKSVLTWFNAEKQMIEQTLQMRKADEKNKMREKLENKLFDLQEQIKNAVPQRPVFTFPTAKKRKRTFTADGPVVIYNLCEGDIADDR